MNLDQGSRTQESDPAAGVGACDAEGAVRHGTAPPLDGLSQRELATQLEIHRVELEVQNQQLREMQASLERARHRYFTLFDISPVGYFVVNRAGLVFELNLRAAEMAGLERARLLKRNLLHHISTERLAAFDAFLVALFTEERSQRVEVAFVAGDGAMASAHVQMDGLRLPSLEDEEPCCLLVCTDVSERKNAEENRLRLERQVLEGQRLESIGLLAGGVAHDFNNLLTGILGNLGVMEEQSAGADARREPLQQAMMCARRAAELCQQLLAYAGRARFEAQTIDLNVVCRDTAGLVRSNYASRARLDLDLAASLPPVVADATQLGQVILNLLINAFESIHQPPGCVTLSTGVAGAEGAGAGGTVVQSAPSACVERRVFIEVRDTGCGMTDEVRERIFEPFFTTKFAGRGLGLAASAGIVKAHRGVIGVRSRVGEGTIFRLELPVGDGLSTSSAAEMIGGRVEWDGTEIAGCVLVVDDEMPVRKVVVRALARIGLHLVESPGGEEALRLLDGGAVRPDVVLMDLTMPGMGATDLLVQLRQRIPAVPVVVMSGFCEEDVLKRLDGRMTEGFLSKPFVPSVLQEKVVQVLTAARRAHAG